MKKQDVYQLLYGQSVPPEERPRWVGLALGFVVGLVLYVLAHGLSGIL